LLRQNIRQENLGFEHNVLTGFIENNPTPNNEKLLFICSISPLIEEIQNNKNILEVSKPKIRIQFVSLLHN